jgi:general stress protein 26
MFERLEDVAAARRACRDVMRVAEVVYVTTLDDGGTPITRAVFNLRRAAQFPDLVGIFEEFGDDPVVLIGTNTASEKLRHLARDPRLNLYYCVPGSFQGVMLGGSADLVSDPATRRRLWQDGWERYYPQGVDDPDYTVLRLRPTRIRGWLDGHPFDFAIEVGS